MARTLTAGVETAIAGADGEFIHLIELNFSGGTSRLATSSVNILWNGFTWTAIGGLLELGDITESLELGSGGVALTLSAVDQTILAAVLTGNYRGRTGQIWRAHISGGALIADPTPFFRGYLNGEWEATETRSPNGTGTARISTRLVSRLSDLERVRSVLSNMESHGRIAGGDTFFRTLPGLLGKRLIWGRIERPFSGGTGNLPTTPSDGGGMGTFF